MLRYLLLTSLLALSGQASVAQGVRAAGLTHNNQETHLFLEFPAQGKHRIFTLEAPNRIVIDLEGVVISSALQALPAQVRENDATLAGIRIGRFNAKVTRVVLDIKTGLPNYHVSNQVLSDKTQRLDLQWTDSTTRDVTAARLLSSPQGNHLSFDIPACSTFRVFTLTESNQIVIELDGVSIGPALRILPKKLRSDDPSIAAVQVKQLDAPVVRIEFAMKTTVPELQVSTRTLFEQSQRLIVLWNTPPAPLPHKAIEPPTPSPSEPTTFGVAQ